MKLIKTFKVGPDNLTLYIGANDSGELRIGSKREYVHGLMHTFVLVDSGWYNILHTFDNIDRILLHLQCRDGNWWCNIGKDLPPDNDIFPYLFLSALNVKVLDKLLSKEKFE